MKRGTRLALILTPLALAGLAVYFFSDILVYFCIAAVLSLMGRPLMDVLMKLKIRTWAMPAGLSALLTMAVLIGIAGTLFAIFIPTLGQQAVKLQQSVSLTDMERGLSAPISNVEALLHTYQLVEPEFDLMTSLQDWVTSFLASVQISSLVTSLIGITGDVFIGFFSVMFITFFLLQERRMLRNIIQALLPDDIEDKVDKVLVTIRKLLSRYFIGLLIEILLVGGLISIGLGLLGVENAAIIGFFAGIFNVIPYVGPILGAIFGLVFTVISSLELDFYTETLPLLAKVAAVFMVVQMADNFIFQPLIYSSSVKAHPLEIFVVILMGANLAGIGGMILAIPVYTILRVIAKEFFSQFEVVRSITGGVE